MSILTREIADGYRLALGDVGFLGNVVAVVVWNQSLEDGEIIVEWTSIIASLGAFLLGVYLLVALLKPEWFS